MKITLLLVGKTDEAYLKKGIEEYVQRIRRYIPFELKIIKDIKKGKNFTNELVKRKEGKLILDNAGRSACMVLLDEKGKSFSSMGFSGFVQKKMASGLKDLVFVIGGAYGFSDEVYNKTNEKISMSNMTFPHQLIRLIFLEQLYRAFTILNNEPYHHD